MKDELVALVTHELRSPVTSILGYLEMLLEDDSLGDDKTNLLRPVERNAWRLLRPVGDLLFLAQAHAGKPRAAAKSVELVLEADPDRVTRADRQRRTRAGAPWGGFRSRPTWDWRGQGGPCRPCAGRRS